MIPIAGSAYTYTYVTMGEFVAWIIGWDLILEYLIDAATVSVGWSRYTVSLLEDVFSTNFSTAFTQAPIIFNEHTHEFTVTGNYFNLPAVVIFLTITVLLMFGIKGPARVNAVAVVIKIFVNLFTTMLRCLKR
uniref:Uncharacterized protein n=1 Tax=Plectus sambesii TaxID=2011161 RepID=A0A914WP63_9BILA